MTTKNKEFYAGAQTFMWLVLKRNVVKATLKSQCREFSSEFNKMSLKAHWAYRQVGWIALQDLQLCSITCSRSAQENAAPVGLCSPGLPQQLCRAGGMGRSPPPAGRCWPGSQALSWPEIWPEVDLLLPNIDI